MRTGCNLAYVATIEKKDYAIATTRTLSTIGIRYTWTMVALFYHTHN